MRHSIILLPLLYLAAPVAAQQPDDLNRVIDEGLNHSQVMQIAQHLTDDIGGRRRPGPPTSFANGACPMSASRAFASVAAGGLPAPR